MGETPRQTPSLAWRVVRNDGETFVLRNRNTGERIAVSHAEARLAVIADIELLDGAPLESRAQVVACHKAAAIRGADLPSSKEQW